MQLIKYAITAFFLFVFPAAYAQKTMAVNHFEKVIISPHIQVAFVKGATEGVTVQHCTVDRGKLHIEVNDKTLRVYLEGAKDIEENKKENRNGHEEMHAIYHGTVVTATVSYKTLNDLSIRGEEMQFLKSAIKGEEFRLKIYGESKVTFNQVELNELQATIYGESTLVLLSGSITNQRYTAYGESTTNALAVKGKNARLTAYGEADFKMNVSDEISIKALGEAKLEYKGNPAINKGLHIGELHITKLD